MTEDLTDFSLPFFPKRIVLLSCYILISKFTFKTVQRQDQFSLIHTVKQPACLWQLQIIDNHRLLPHGTELCSLHCLHWCLSWSASWWAFLWATCMQFACCMQFRRPGASLPTPSIPFCSLHPFGKLHPWGCTTEVLCAISIYTEMTQLAHTLATFLTSSRNMWILLCSFDMSVLKSIKQRGRDNACMGGIFPNWCIRESALL